MTQSRHGGILEHLTISSAAFERHLLSSWPTLIFHLAAVESHDVVMVARSPKPVKNRLHVALSS
jgi:hypothetical protein